VASAEIHSIQSVSGNQPRMRRIIEELGQVFLSGVPVQIVPADGGVKEWDTTIANTLAGFSKEPASNLAATAPSPLTTTIGIGGPAGAQGAKVLTFGAVPFEPSAINIPRGAPLNDGRVGFEPSDADTIFYGQVGPAQTTVAGDVGKLYGLTKDADNHWFVDKTKTGASAAVSIVKLDPNDLSATPRGVYFVVLPAAAQLVA
jgi:hypothetical protein